MHYVAYPVVDALPNEAQSIEIATFRPEFILGDVALAVHPSDKRYRNLVGRFALNPLTNVEIPIIGDTDVNPNEGNGVFQVCPNHCPRAYKLAQNHQVSEEKSSVEKTDVKSIALDVQVMDFDGNIWFSDKQDEAYVKSKIKIEGMDRLLAREEILNELERIGLYRGYADAEQEVKICRHTGNLIEEIFSAQWYFRLS